MINRNWVFGRRAGLDFSTDPPTATSGFSINTREGCASISDGSGNLLFYTDGITIWDSSHAMKTNTLLGDSSSTQSSIIVPDPGNNNQYYIFTIDGSSNSSPPFNHFNGVLVNVNTWVVTPLSSLMTLPNTLGFSPAEKVVAVQHQNCRDFWVITIVQQIPPGLDQDGTTTYLADGEGVFRVFLVNSSGVTHVGDTVMNQNIYDLGYLKGSPNGQRLAIANGKNANVLVYPFDNSTGVINTGGLIAITVPTTPKGINRTVYGVEFSPDSNLLYYGNLASGSQQGYIFQVDLTITPASTLVGTVANAGGNYAIGALQLGMDNRIYFAKDNESVLGAIQNPDTVGTGCNVNNNFLTLLTNSRCQLGLPNLLPNPCEKNDCDCGCSGCNDNAEEQNEELVERAKTKYHTIKSDSNCSDPFEGDCDNNAVSGQVNLEPCFYFHWGDGSNDQIEEHDTEVFYITACNNFNDIQYNGLRITKLTLIPDVHPLDKIHVVPDRFINFDCLKPCSCQAREFALITRANDIAGNYTVEVEYCYEGIIIASGGNSGVVEFPVEITED